MRAGAKKGIKTMVSGRLDGAEIARSELPRRFDPSADTQGRDRLRFRYRPYHIRHHRRKGMDLQGRKCSTELKEGNN